MDNCNSNEIKHALIEVFKQSPKTQVQSIMNRVEQKINHALTKDDEHIILELIHEFSTSNIIMPAADRFNSGWPWFSVTKHGKKILSESGPPVYDYEGYLSVLKEKVKNIDQIVLRYVSESLRAFQLNLYYSSMVMLACCSERVILLLINSYIEAIDNEANKNKLKSRISKRDISSKYDEFKKSFNSVKNQIYDIEISNDFDLQVESIFNFVRLIRNSIVHPDSLPKVTSAIVYSNLQQFIYYVVTIYQLIEYFCNNKITL